MPQINETSWITSSIMFMLILITMMISFFYSKPKNKMNFVIKKNLKSMKKLN